MRTLFVMTALVSVVALSACGRTSSSDNWSKPKATAYQIETDKRRCKRVANKYLDQHDSFDADSTDSGSYSSMMDGYQSRKRYNELVSDCMARLGYSSRR